jgi:hypothetical protein
VTPHDFPDRTPDDARRVVWYLRTVPGCHTAAELCNALHVNSRDLQYAIQWARSQGDKDLSSIIGDSNGYRWDQSQEAAREAMAQFASRHRAMRLSVEGIVKAAGPGALQEELGL